jgi:hypothetical protein
MWSPEFTPGVSVQLRMRPVCEPRDFLKASYTPERDGCPSWEWLPSVLGGVIYALKRLHPNRRAHRCIGVMRVWATQGGLVSFCSCVGYIVARSVISSARWLLAVGYGVEVAQEKRPPAVHE